MAALAAAVIGLYGCITDYTPEHINELSDLLVVESTITNGTTHVKLSQSVGLLDYMSRSKNIENATVAVETEDGSFSKQGTYTGNGNYEIETGVLNTAAKYRLYIKAGGEEYASSFLTPVITPEIDSLSWIKRGEGEPVYMCVSTHNGNDQSIYYRWTYDEHWEIKAEYFANAAIVYEGFIRKMVYYDLHTSNNRYYCWAKDSSRSLILDTSEKLKDNIISQKRLTEISPSDDRLSQMYYMSVSQTSLRLEAYNYFRNVQKNVEQTGGIFSSVPSESKGNIRCLTDPQTPVIGYVEVATTAKKDIYIPSSTGLYEPLKTECVYSITTASDIPGTVILYYDPYSTTTYIQEECVNCLKRNKATKDKPSWWPTTHF